MTEPMSDLAPTAQLLRTFGDALHTAAAALDAGDERRASALLRAVHDAVCAAEPAQDWDMLRQLLEPHVSRLQVPAWPFGEPIDQVLDLNTWEASPPVVEGKTEGSGA